MTPRVSRTSPLLACLVTLSFLACGNDTQNVADEGTGDSDTGGSSGTGGSTTEQVCEPGETQTCVGPGACDGGQECSDDGREWLPCDCGGSGGSAGSGGTDTGGNNPGGAGGAETGGTDTGGNGSGSASTGGNGTAGASPSLPISVEDGWASGAGIQGAVFAYHDAAGTTVVDGITGDQVCISGEAAMVDLACEFGDCYDYYWGAAIGLNLNQPRDPETGEPTEIPLPYDGTGLQGFSFTVTGATIPTALRFFVEDADGLQYCHPAALLPGSNTFFYEDLVTQCWDTTGGAINTFTEGSSLIKISWRVATNSSSSVPFDFCISNIRAIPD